MISEIKTLPTNECIISSSSGGICPKRFYNKKRKKKVVRKSADSEFVYVIRDDGAFIAYGACCNIYSHTPNIRIDREFHSWYEAVRLHFMLNNELPK